MVLNIENYQYINLQSLYNLLMIICDFILIGFFAEPAMNIKKSVENSIRHLINSPHEHYSSRQYALMIIKKIYQNISFFKFAEINYRFVFMMMITGFSYVIIIIQFELESSKINSFNIFDMRFVGA